MPERTAIILTGFMGAGKTSVGRVLAERLDLPFIDLDAQIVRCAGRDINEIFATDGESLFRELEQRMLAQVLGRGPSVLATGGGAVISEGNRRIMRRHGLIVNLQVSRPSVLERLKNSADRPLLAGEDPAGRVLELMAAREQFYEDADIRIDTNGKSVEDVAAEILSKMKELPA